MKARQAVGTLAAAIVAAGCGGGGGSSALTIPSAQLTSTDDVAAQAGTVTEMAAALDTFGQLDNGGTTAAASTRSAPRAVAACADGTVERTEEQKDAGSPFTDQPFNATIVTWRRCAHTHGGSGPGGSFSTTVVLDGRAEAGTNVEPPPHVFYSQAGAGPEQRLHADVTHSRESDAGQGTADYAYQVYARRDGTESNADGRRELQHRMHLRGRGAMQGTSPQGQFRHEFRTESFVGAPDEPFVVTMDPGDGNSHSFDGVYGFVISPPPPDSRCHGGRARVSTLVRLMPETGDTGSPWSAGTLHFESGDRSATVTFNDDGTVTVTDSAGRSVTMPYSAFAQRRQACAGMAHSGVPHLGPRPDAGPGPGN